MSGCGGLLNHCRVLLDDLVHLIDGRIDLREASGLFLGGGRDLGDQRVNIGHLRHDLVESPAGFTDQLDTLTDLLA